MTVLNMKKFLILCLASCILISSSMAYAQDGAENDLNTRLELARKMHELRPVKPQVDRAIENVASALPTAKQEEFRVSMQRILNYPAIENLSIEIMAETYSAAELKVMIDYYQQPLAQSAAEKTIQYQQKLGPEIIRIMDRAMMEMRTGGSSP